MFLEGLPFQIRTHKIGGKIGADLLFGEIIGTMIDFVIRAKDFGVDLVRLLRAVALRLTVVTLLVLALALLRLRDIEAHLRTEEEEMNIWQVEEEEVDHLEDGAGDGEEEEGEVVHHRGKILLPEGGPKIIKHK